MHTDILCRVNRARFGSLILLALCFCLFLASAANAADRLPLEDGTYATDAQYCQMSRSDVVALTEGGLLDIEGRSTSLYETECSLQSYTQHGDNLAVKMVCEAEGESFVSSENWKMLTSKAFIDGNDTKWIHCGKVLE